jgi:hypothetical protein
MGRIERLQVTNHERWGKLVKTWATGNNYLEDENEYPLPTTMEEFKEQLAKAQVFATVRPCSTSRAQPIRFRRSTNVCSTASTRSSRKTRSSGCMPNASATTRSPSVPETT